MLLPSLGVVKRENGVFLSRFAAGRETHQFGITRHLYVDNYTLCHQLLIVIANAAARDRFPAYRLWGVPSTSKAKRKAIVLHFLMRQIFFHCCLIDWCCFYYFLRNSLVALLEALFARECVALGAPGI